MKIGITPNYLKENIFEFLDLFIIKLNNAEIDYVFSDSVKKIKQAPKKYWDEHIIFDNDQLAHNCDAIVSIGGDGTLLRTAYYSRESGTPLIGVNFGKLGFLAEYDTNKIDKLVKYLKTGDFILEKRIALDAVCLSEESDKLYAINDIVIDRGRYPKMIEITIEIDDEYVATFSADGIIVATPTGSTGYSLSTGGPIVNPKTHSIILSPISPHMLTMRPLVISGSQKVVIKANSPHKNVEVICDGQRVNYFKPTTVIEINRSKYDLKLLHSKEKTYFDILRRKLYWGLDLRIANNGNGGFE